MTEKLAKLSSWSNEGCFSDKDIELKKSKYEDLDHDLNCRLEVLERELALERQHREAEDEYRKCAENTENNDEKASHLKKAMEFRDMAMGYSKRANELRNSKELEELMKLRRVLDNIRRAIEEESRYHFTTHYEFQMLGRTSELDTIKKALDRAFGSNEKDENQVIGVVSSPRQGKSLMLDMVAAEARKHTHCIAIKMTINGGFYETSLQSLLNEDIAVVEKLFWKNALRLPDGYTVSSADRAIDLLDYLFPECQKLLLVDELTKLLNSVRDVKSLAGKIFNFHSRTCAMVFTGFDLEFYYTYCSTSGRKTVIVPLPPVSPYFSEALEYLPLKKKYFETVAERKEDVGIALLHYHLARVTPGVVGAMIQSRYKDIAFMLYLENTCDACLELVTEYVALGDLPEARSVLGQRLMKSSLGVLLERSVKDIDTSFVFIPPLFVYHLVNTTKKRNRVVEALQLAFDVVREWGKAKSKSNSKAASRRQGKTNGDYFEYFVAACREVMVVAQDGSEAPAVCTRNDNALPSERIPRLTVEYPNNQDPIDENKYYLTKEGTEAVDMVRRCRRDGKLYEEWVQDKCTAHAIELGSFEGHLGRFAKNARASNVCHVSFYFVGPLPNEHHGPPIYNFGELLKEIGQRLCCPESGFTFVAEFVELGTLDADRYLCPILASIAPNLDSLPLVSWEKKLPLGPNAAGEWKTWLPIKTSPEFFQHLDDTQFEKAMCILKNCDVTDDEIQGFRFKWELNRNYVAPPDKNLAIIGLALEGLCLLNVLFFQLAAGTPYYFVWFLITVLLAAKSALAVFLICKKNLRQIPRALPNCVDGSFLFSGLVLVFLRPHCLFLLVLAIALHTFIDLLHVQRSALRIVIPNIERTAGSVMDSVSSQVGRSVERVASAFEIVTLLLIPFARSGILLFPLYIIFLALRYRTSYATRLNFHAADAQLTTLLTNKSVPPLALENYKYVKERVAKVVTK